MLTRIKQLGQSKFVRNVAIVATGTAGAQAITMAFAPVITRLYGPEAFGLLGTFVAILGVLTPVAALTYPIAMVLPESDYEAKLLGKLSARIALVIAFFLAIALFAVPAGKGYWLEVESISMWALIPAAMLFSALQQILLQWLIRKRRFSITARVAIIQAALLYGSMAVVGWFYPEGSILIILSALGYFLHVILLWIGVKKGGSTEDGVGTGSNKTRTLFYMAHRYRDFPLYRAPQVTINALSQSLPVFMLAALFGAEAAGFFALSKMVLAAPSALIGRSVGEVFYPRAAEAFAKKESVRGMFFRSTIGLFGMALVPLLIVIVFGPLLFKLVFGEEWYAAGGFAQWMALWVAFSLAARPCIALIPILKLQGVFLVHEVVFLIAKAVGLYIGLLMGSDAVAVALYSVVSAVSYVLLFFIVLWKVSSVEA